MNILNKINIFKPPGKNLTVRDDDTFIVSYPKSGNTWLRLFIYSYYYKDTTFKSIHKKIPDIYKQPKYLFNFAKSPRLIKSHEPYNSMYKKVIYIVRHPYFVSKSYLNFFRKYNRAYKDLSYESFIKMFNNDELDSFGNWVNHVSGWINSDLKENFLMVRYENLLNTPRSEFIKIINFFYGSYEETKIDYAILQTEFSRLKNAEVNNKMNLKMIPKGNSNYNFFNIGKNIINQDEYKIFKKNISSEFKNLSNTLGYEI